MVAAAGGKRWKRDKEPHIAGDASDHAYAAYIPNGEYEHAVLISFTPLVAQNKYSSTLRELTCILWTVKVVLETEPHRIQHSTAQRSTAQHSTAQQAGV
ncbi:TPA: hypothetical protein ACH3X1_011110 [Trebouxia sp. C0004]